MTTAERAFERPVTDATVVVEARGLGRTFGLHTPWSIATRRAASSPSTT